LDDLKRINDTLGHLAGDTALKSVASFVSSRIRKSDSLGRWGGDEFLIVTPETDLKGAIDMAAKLQQGLREFELPEIGELSISIGVSSKKENDSSYDDILRRADKALYESKARGKNTVTAI
jgi:diguanylate cyclase (GGDEF)-like protein